jgi:hypothetical protein
MTTDAPARRKLEIREDNSGSMFFNEDGTITGAIMTDGIYITCQLKPDEQKETILHLSGNSEAGDLEGERKIYKTEITVGDNGKNKPDYTGRFEIGGIEKRFAGWTKISKNNNPYIYVRISERQAGNGAAEG